MKPDGAAASGGEEGGQLDQTHDLDPNHRFFLLVDNGTFRKPDQDTELRLKLMDAISKYSPSRDEEGKRTDKRLDFNTRRVPVLNIVVGGNLSVFSSISMSLQYKMPCLIVRNSGGVADFLDGIMRKLPHKRLNLEDDDARSQLIRKLFTECSSNDFLRQMKASLKAEHWRDFIEVVLDIVQSRHLISFIDLAGSNSATVSDVEDQILEKVMTGKMSAFNRVNLALNLNKDASSRVMKDAFQNLEKDEIMQLMIIAMLRDRPKFVVNFIKFSGASLSEFLTANTLLKMYRQTPRGALFNRVYRYEMGHDADTSLLSTIETFLTRLLNSSYRVELWNSNPGIGPERHLFLFSLLLMKPKSMEYYWNESVGGTGSALLACRYLRAIADHPELDDEPEEQKKLLSLASFYEDKAIKIVEACSADNEIRTLKLITYKQDIWFKNDLIEVADQSDSVKFIACEEVQEVLDWKWLGRMSAQNSKLLVYLTIFLPFLVLFLKFDADPEASEKEARKNREKSSDEGEIVYGSSKPKRKRVPWHKKIIYFYSSPFVKMLVYYTSFFLFVVAFGYVILYEQQTQEYQFYPFRFNIEGNFVEFLVMIYVITLVIEEVRQMLYSSSDPIWKNLAIYFGSFWNWIDVVAILLFLPGMVLRWLFYDGNNPEGFDELQIAARSLYILSLLCFMIRMVHCLSLSDTIGPKILMLSKMTGDLVFFVVCLVVFMFSFGTAINAFLYPTMGREHDTDGNANFVDDPIRSIVDHTFWPTFGEVYQVASEMGIPGSKCEADVNPYGVCQDSTTYEFLAACVYAIYVFLTNIVLVNLLVAMMVYSFNRVQKDADEEYKIEKFRFQKEFYTKPAFPPPFSPFVILKRLIVYAYEQATSNYNRVSLPIYTWERQNKREVLVKVEGDKEKAASVNNRVNRLETRMNYLVQIVEGTNDESNRTQMSVMETLGNLQKSMNDMSLLVSAILPPSYVQSTGPNRKTNQKYIKALTNIELRTTGHSSSSDVDEDTSGFQSDQGRDSTHRSDRSNNRAPPPPQLSAAGNIFTSSAIGDNREETYRRGGGERTPSLRSADSDRHSRKTAGSDKSSRSGRHRRTVGVGGQ